jgi:uncharacterized protein YvpB
MMKLTQKNILAICALLGAGLIIMAAAFIFASPPSALNLFLPSRPPTFVIPGDTPTEPHNYQLPSTWTPTSSAAASPALAPLDVTSTITPTLYVVPTFTPTDSPTATLPPEHFIYNISGHKQYFPLGCETAAAKDWANYFHKDFNEFEFQYRLPLSDNPDLGFVGDVNAPWGQVPPYGYGVYAGPVADLLNTYGIPAKAYKGYTLEQIKAKIAQDKPVIVWVIGNMVGGVPSEYTDKKGNKVVVAAYEHVVIVTGYDATHIRYMNNGKFYQAPNEVFLNSWGVLGNMVVVDP